MKNEELMQNMQKVKKNLENVKVQLNLAKNLLNESITFNNNGFKTEEISNLQININNQIYALNNKILPKINNM